MDAVPTVDLCSHLEVLTTRLEARAHPTLPPHHVLTLLIVVVEVGEVEADEGNYVMAACSNLKMLSEVTGDQASPPCGDPGSSQQWR